jgi:ferredoxin
MPLIKRHINKNDILRLLPRRLHESCLIGIADSSKFDSKTRVRYIPAKGKWSAPASYFFHSVRSVIVLIHYTPVAFDYRVENFVVSLAKKMWKVYGIKTHLHDQSGHINPARLLGVEWGPASLTYDRLFLLKDAAYFAGLGRFGRNSLLINGHFGSDFKIQALLTDTPMICSEPLTPPRHHRCASCKTCIVECPSQALKGFCSVDYQRCMTLYRKENISKSIILGKMPKEKSFYKLKQTYTNQLLRVFKNVCRVCQAFCIINQSHYSDRPIILKPRHKD